jgi:signal transduction histidine kinase
MNAADAVAERHASDRRVELRILGPADGAVRIIVADNGFGIPAEKAETIFDSFWTTKRHGMGMGLAICRTIVDQHGGRIWVQNAPQGGARFCVELPHGGDGHSSAKPPTATVQTGDER